VPILVDTGALELLRRRGRAAEALALRYYPPLICTHVAGEFFFGQRHTRVSSTTLEAARRFLESFEILRPGFATAVIYARVPNELIGAGVKLSDPDYWIAAHALEHGLRLLSSDRDFRHFSGLNVQYLGL
jgi:predicted nucleic acid-binding protein